MTVKIMAASRLAASSSSVLNDLKAVGFKAFGYEDGSWQCQKLSESQAQKMCDKLIDTKGYEPQSDDLYPGDDGQFYIQKGDNMLCVDPEGFIYLS